MDIGWQELAIVLLVIVVIFGVGKLPEVGGALGKGMREFRQAATERPDTPSETMAAISVETVDPTPLTTASREEL